MIKLAEWRDMMDSNKIINTVFGFAVLLVFLAAMVGVIVNTFEPAFGTFIGVIVAVAFFTIVIADMFYGAIIAVKLALRSYKRQAERKKNEKKSSNSITLHLIRLNLGQILQ